MSCAPIESDAWAAFFRSMSCVAALARSASASIAVTSSTAVSSGWSETSILATLPPTTTTFFTRAGLWSS